MKAAIRGGHIYFDIAGMSLVLKEDRFVERPTLFLLHGGPGSDHSRYKLHTLALQEVAQLVFIDQRGCGRSSQYAPSSYTLDNNIEDLEALRCHLGIETICLLGTSYGGMVAQGYAIRYPQRVAKLILVATAASYRFLATAKEYLTQHGTQEQIIACEQLWAGNFQSVEEVTHFFTVMESLYSVNPNRLKLPKIEPTWGYEALNEGFRGGLRTFDYEPELSTIPCPTLVLGGEEDWICRPEQLKRIAALIPRSTLLLFPDCGHLVAIDANEDYLKAITLFLR